MKSTRWPIWKIAVAAAGSAVAAVILFVLSLYLEGFGGESEPGGASRQQLMSLPAFIMILGVVAVMLCVLSTV